MAGWSTLLHLDSSNVQRCVCVLGANVPAQIYKPIGCLWTSKHTGKSNGNNEHDNHQTHADNDNNDDNDVK